MPAPMQPSVTLGPDTSDAGLAGMLAGLVRQNLDDHPEKRDVLSRMIGRVAIVASDAEAAVTLLFEAGRLTVHDGVVGIPDLTIRAPTEDITRMSLLELRGRFGLPDPRGETVRAVARASAQGRIEVHGLLGNLPLMLRLARVMSVS